MANKTGDGRSIMIQHYTLLGWDFIFPQKTPAPIKKNTFVYSKKSTAASNMDFNAHGKPFPWHPFTLDFDDVVTFAFRWKAPVHKCVLSNSFNWNLKVGPLIKNRFLIGMYSRECGNWYTWNENLSLQVLFDLFTAREGKNKKTHET